jgi:ribosome maturation factor RimP
MTDQHIIELHLAEILAGQDIFLVGVKIDNNNKIVVHIDTPDGLSIDDCVRISKELEGRLDRDKEDFALEVSSPGLDAPFRVIEQYKKNIGKRISVIKLDGEKLEGILMKLDEKGIVLDEIKNKKDGRKEQLGTKLSFGEIKSTRVSLQL